MDDCMSCIKHSRFNAVLVDDDKRGAGHITIVAAMLMKKPQIISNVAVIKEYFINTLHGVSVPLNNSDKVKEGLSRLDKEPLYSETSKNSYEYASKYFTNKKIAERFVEILIQSHNNIKPVKYNSKWYEEYNLLNNIDNQTI